MRHTRRDRASGPVAVSVLQTMVLVGRLVSTDERELVAVRLSTVDALYMGCLTLFERNI